MKNLQKIYIAILLVMPVVGHAQMFRTGGQQTFATLVNDFIELINLAIPVVMALALVAFLWGVADFLSNPGNEQKRSEGKQFMVWGVIALFVMLSVFGIIEILQSTFFGPGASQGFGL